MEAQIFVPAPTTFMVRIKIHGTWRPVLNWHELQDEARQAAEPELRERWRVHQKKLVIDAIHALETDSIEALMKVATSPSMCYACPPELAAKIEEI